MMKTTNAVAPTAKPTNDSLAAIANAIAFALRKLAIVPSSDFAPVWTARPAWEPQTPTHVISCYYLTRGDGLTLWLVFGSVDTTRAPRGRIAISHSRPRFKDGQYVELWDDGRSKLTSPEITVSESKAPKDIAADIARRLLPDCERIEKLARERIAAHEAHDNAREAMTLRMVEASGGKQRQNWTGGNKEAVYTIDFGNLHGLISEGYGTAYVSSDSVNFDLRSIPAEKAVELARFLREHTFAG